MTQPNYEEREIWTTGRRECITCITVTVYLTAIVALADADQITQYQMRRALDREFPRHAFTFNDTGGKYTLRADANRWIGDGV